MVAWRTEEVDAARHRQAKRNWESCYRTRKHRILRSDNTAVRARDGPRPAKSLGM